MNDYTEEQNLSAAKKKLEELVRSADDDLASLIQLGNGFKLNLNYSLDSLEGVEKLLVGLNGKHGFEYLKSQAWLYIGQVICKTMGGHWIVSNDLTNYREHYLMPVVTGFSKFNDEYCPMVEIEEYIKTPFADFFKDKINALRAGTYRHK